MWYKYIAECINNLVKQSPLLFITTDKIFYLILQVMKIANVSRQ